MPLVTIEKVDSFRSVRAVNPDSIRRAVLQQVKLLDERDEVEAWIQSILNDTNETPHGPSEIVDVLTHKLTVQGESGNGAFILKGRSFSTVRPTHVSHQIFRELSG